MRDKKTPFPYGRNANIRNAVLGLDASVCIGEAVSISTNEERMSSFIWRETR